MSFLDRIFPSTAAPAGVDAAGSEGAAPGPSPDGVTHACPECGTPAAPEQEWCLECGSRIEESSPRWHQPAAVLASVGLILVAGLALALSEVAKDAEVAKAKTVRKYVAAAPPPAAPVPASPTPKAPKTPKVPDTPSTSPNTTDTPSSTPSDAGAAATSPSDLGSSGSGSTDTGSTPDSSSGSSGGSSGGGGSSTTTPTPTPVEEWPAGKKATTVILLSTTSRDEAEALARKARAKGVPAGILDSTKYKNLSDGLWMVWAGRFGSEDEAYAAADEYSAKGFAGESVEYVREKGPEDSGDTGSDGTSTDGKTTSTETSPSGASATDTTGGGTG